jgi:hypothetical protein
MSDDIDQHKPKTGNAIGPLTGLANARAKLKAMQIADLERRRAVLLARREIIDRDIKQLDGKLDELRERVD